MIRLLTGAIALGAVFATAALLDPEPESLDHRASTTIEVVPADLPIGCPGWMILPVGEGGEGDGGLAPGASDVIRTTLTDGEQTVIVGSGFASEASVGLQVERVGHGDLASLAATTCVRPSRDAWLVGGSTRLGSSARLVLINPSAVVSEVVITIFGPTGPVDQAIVISMGARTSESLLLEGVAAELATLVVHIEAGGAGIVSAIQDSRLAGFIPAGTDWVSPGAGPSTSLVLPAVGPGDPEGIDGPAVVRLMAPDGATASLTLVGEAGEQRWPGTKDIVLEPGIPVDLDVPAAPRSVVVVEADRPVVAAALTRTGRIPDEGLEGDVAWDLSWSPAQVPREGSAMNALMPPYTVSVVVYADAQTVFRLRDAVTGELHAEKLMGAGTVAELPLVADPGTLLAVEGEVSWVLVVEDGPFRTIVPPVDLRDKPVTILAVPMLFLP